ncbi:hypothetical protein [Paracidobacterium acidisoli]|uniref:Uncharacterized protein n=1 Tax=Paracidobacterium acidisoli TaxID=2303751 RepID=A0A372IP86_9BACT|nr:hypothetical protein [Paracidobacterium acidisoli]MBT9330983.1 hypothetical protein [Paracidobacterium acidisoli]
MPCLELKIAEKPHAQPGTRLRALLDKPNAAVLRRNHIAEVNGPRLQELHEQLRITAVLAVDITHPPAQKPAQDDVEEAEANDLDEAIAEMPEDRADGEFSDSFAAGLEIWIALENGAARVLVDADEIPGALLVFDAYSRLARYQPAYLRLDQRKVGICYTFREGLTIGLEGDPKLLEEHEAAEVFENMSAIAEIDDVRERRLVTRLPHAGIAYCQSLLQSASEWLSENSYQSILGS